MALLREIIALKRCYNSRIYKMKRLSNFHLSYESLYDKIKLIIKGGIFMAPVNAEHINLYISAAQKVISEIAQIQTTIGKPYLRTISDLEGQHVMVLIGITGVLKGQVILLFKAGIACEIASRMMMGMPVPELNELAKSAISELCNMILGNAATLFSNKAIPMDITPPSVLVGDNLSISVSDTKIICVPLTFDTDKSIELNIAIKE